MQSSFTGLKLSVETERWTDDGGEVKDMLNHCMAPEEKVFGSVRIFI